MDESISGILIILHSFLRIGITIYCISRAKDLNRSQFGWGVFGLLLPLLALIWILFLKTKQLNPQATINDIQSSAELNLRAEEEKCNQLLKEIELQKTEIQKLKLHNLLTDEEYIIKEETVLKRNESIKQELDKIKLEQELEKVKTVINDEINSIIVTLENTFKSGLINQDELETKKLQLFNERYNTILGLPYCNPNFQFNMELLKEKDLNSDQKNDLRHAFHSFKIGNVILYSKSTKKLTKVSSKEFIKFNSSNDASKYFYVEISNFLSRLGYPHLQSKFLGTP